MFSSTKNNLSNIVEKALDGTALTILLIFVIVLASDVIDMYTSKKSAMSNMEQPISEHPTVTICFGDRSGSLWNREMYELETEVNITYYVNET